MKTLLYFSATWCQTCEELDPIVDDVVSETKKEEETEILKCDVDESTKLADKHNISVVPTFVLLVDGKQVKKFVGKKSKEEILEELKVA